MFKIERGLEMETPRVVSLSASIEPLVAEFNRRKDKARLIALVSPT